MNKKMLPQQIVISSLLTWALTTNGASADLLAGQKTHTETFQIHGTWATLTTSEDRKIQILEACLRPKTPCLAREKLLELRGSKIEKTEEDGTANLGAMICKKIGGKILLGRNRQHDQNSFCEFFDKSIVDSGTLAYFSSLAIEPSPEDRKNDDLERHPKNQ